MKIRVMGTKEECELAQEYYKEFVHNNEQVQSYSISDLYANRGNSNLYRVYIDITYKIITEPAGGSNGNRTLRCRQP